MAETPTRLVLPSGEYEVVDEAGGRGLRVGVRRVVVDGRNRPTLTPERIAKLDKVRRYRWWNATYEFPAAPDELAQFRALVNWVGSFALMSAMLMAPGLGAGFTALARRYAIQITQAVSMGVAVVALLLLVLLMQRVAAPLWGARGDPGLVLRRLFLLSLPTPVMAATATLVRPSEAIETVALGFLTGQFILLGLLVIWFLYHYFGYTGVVPAVKLLGNTTPRDALRNFYALLRTVGTPAERRERLEEAVQYLASFRGSRHVPAPKESEEPSRWQGPPPAKSQTLSEWAWEASRRTAEVHIGDERHEFDVADLIILRAVADGGLTGACVLQVRALAGLEAGLEAVQQVVRRAHRISSFDDGWYLEEAPDALTAGDFAALQQAGLLRAARP